MSAVPCLRRAAAVEEYGEQTEREVEAGDEGEGWITADRSARPGAAAGVTTTNDDGFEEVPSIEEASGGDGGAAAAEGVSEAAGGSSGRGGAEEEEVPDIDELELEDEEEDEVSGSRAEVPAWQDGQAGQGCSARSGPAVFARGHRKCWAMLDPAMPFQPPPLQPASAALLPIHPCAAGPAHPAHPPGGAAAGATQRRRRWRRRGAHCADADVRPAHHL